MQLITL